MATRCSSTTIDQSHVRIDRPCGDRHRNYVHLMVVYRKEIMEIEAPTKETLEWLILASRAYVAEFYVTGEDHSDYNAAYQWIQKLQMACGYQLREE
jgi:hypothetical protein